MTDGPDTRAAAATDSDLSGRQLGDYQILRRLGRGGMADVYLAEQGSLRRQVAFKVLKSTLASDEAYVRRFRQEATAAATVSHANIVQIYDINCVDGVHYIAQEYVKGQNLRQVLGRQTSIDARLALHVMRQVAAALHRAGQKGIIHRDIKPENIMLAPTGEVKVTDFGLARVLQNGDMNLTQVGITMGTPLYMSPEQVEGKAADQRSDLYSFGVTCYHVLAGRPPFVGETPLSIAVQHLKSEPQSLAELRPDLPPGLCRIVHKLMAKSPAERFASAADLLRELRTLQPVDADEEWNHEALAAIEQELTGADFAPMAATQQLQAVMQKTQTIAWRARQRSWQWVPIGIFAALALGGLFAWATKPPPLLAIPQNERSEIARFGKVQEQYYFAVTSPVQSIAAYEAVWKYFPPAESQDNQYYARLAKKRLAKLHRDQGQIDKAMATYKELAATENQDPEFGIVGHLGLANIYASEDPSAAAQQLSAAAALMTRARIPADRREDLLRTLDEPLRAQWQRSIQTERGGK
jgi:predicted Ser/Thr protein kinase/tetratricopeptide (TPR) repeat protein